jgi:hypothetical protein
LTSATKARTRSEKCSTTGRVRPWVTLSHNSKKNCFWPYRLPAVGGGIGRVRRLCPCSQVTARPQRCDSAEAFLVQFADCSSPAGARSRRGSLPRKNSTRRICASSTRHARKSREGGWLRLAERSGPFRSGFAQFAGARRSCCRGRVWLADAEFPGRRADCRHRMRRR